MPKNSAKIVSASSSNLSPIAQKIVARRKAANEAAKIAGVTDKLVAAPSTKKADKRAGIVARKIVKIVKAVEKSLPGKPANAVSVIATKAVKGKLVNKAVKAVSKGKGSVGGKASPKDKAVAKAAGKAAQTGVRPDTAKGRVYAMAQRKNGVALEDVVKAGISINLVAARALIGDLRRMGYDVTSMGNGAYKA